MNFETARLNMIEQQIRTWEVLNPQVLDLLTEIHREDFMPDKYKELAFADICIPLAHGQVTMTPRVEARILQSVSVLPGDKVLEIGTGCAYLTALLGLSAKEVISIDIYPEFTREAGIKLGKYNLNNIKLETGDAINGWEKESPYDVIVVTGSLPELSQAIKKQLNIGGRLFVIIGDSPVMEATLITRVADNAWQEETLFEIDFPPLVGAHKQVKFEL